MSRAAGEERQQALVEAAPVEQRAAESIAGAVQQHVELQPATAPQPRGTARLVPLDSIDLDASPVVREAMNEEAIADYSGRLDDLPAVQLVQVKGGPLLVADGRHRIRANRNEGRDEIRAEVSEGTRQSAVLAALAANREHGVRRTAGDLRRVIKTALAEPSLRQLSNVELAKACHCSESYFREVRGLLERAGAVDPAPQRVGADGKTRMTPKRSKSEKKKGAPIDASGTSKVQDCKSLPPNGGTTEQTESASDGSGPTVLPVRGDREEEVPTTVVSSAPDWSAELQAVCEAVKNAQARWERNSGALAPLVGRPEVVSSLFKELCAALQERGGT